MAEYETFLRRLKSLPLIPPKQNDPIRVSDPENCRFSVLFWSDMHVSDLFLRQTNVVRACALDVQRAKGIDVLTFGGDLTDNGRYNERRFIAELFETMRSVAHILPVYGNHDVRFRDFGNTVKAFDALCSAAEPGLKPGRLWYAFDCNSYRLHILGTCATRFEETYIDEEEFRWLSESLSRTAAAGKPAFVLNHQPLQNTHNLPHSWDAPVDGAGSVGPQSERLRKLLERFPNVFYFVGHLHRGFNVNTYEEVNNVHSICLPSTGLRNKDCEQPTPGLGILMEVYDDRVLLRARDFLHGQFLPQYEKTYRLSS